MMGFSIIFFVFLITGMALFVGVADDLAFGQVSQSSDLEVPQPKLIHNVAAEFTESGDGFDIEYFLSVNLEDVVIINPEEKNVVFNIAEEGISEKEILEIHIPSEILDLPLRVYIDGIQEPDSITSGRLGVNTMFIPLKEGSKEIKIEGMTVIPEFGEITILVLTVSIISTIVLLNTKSKLFTLPKFYP